MKLMKIRRMLILLLIAAMMTAALSACGNGSKKTLAEHGMDVVSLMAEMVESEDYCELYSPDAYRSVVERVADGDFDEPENVYAVTVKPEKALKSLGVSDDMLDDLSEPVKEALCSRAYSAIISQLNSTMGVDYIAVAAIYMAEKTFVSEDIEENVMYVYTFEDSVPVAVAFVMGEDGSVSANGWFMFSDGLNFDSAEDLEDSLRDMYRGCEVTEIEYN